MKYNNYVWSMTLTYIHTNKDLFDRFILVHNNHNETIFVYDIHYSKKRKVDYVYQLKNDTKLLKEIIKRGRK